eukprot:14702-Hanusia_phi.AAC.3
MHSRSGVGNRAVQRLSLLHNLDFGFNFTRVVHQLDNLRLLIQLGMQTSYSVTAMTLQRSVKIDFIVTNKSRRGCLRKQQHNNSPCGSQRPHHVGASDPFASQGA